MILGGHELISLVVAGGAQVEGVSLFAASVGAKLNVHVNVRLQHIDRLRKDGTGEANKLW